MATLFIGISLFALIASILFLGYTANGIKPVHYIAVFFVIGGIATLFKEISSSEKTDSIKKTGQVTLQEVTGLKSQNEILKSTQQDLLSEIKGQEILIDKLRTENTELNGKLQEASKIIFEHVKGGLGPIRLDILLDKINTYKFVLFNENAYSVYGLVMNIIDYDKLVKCRSKVVNGRTAIDAPCLDANSANFSLDEMGVGYIVLDKSRMGAMDISANSYGRILIKYNARYSIFWQQLVWKKIDGLVFTTSRFIELDKLKPDLIKSKKVVKSEGINDWIVDFDKEFSLGINLAQATF